MPDHFLLHFDCRAAIFRYFDAATPRCYHAAAAFALPLALMPILFSLCRRFRLDDFADATLISVQLPRHFAVSMLCHYSPPSF
jgi:hypothetical protein